MRIGEQLGYKHMEEIQIMFHLTKTVSIDCSHKLSLPYESRCNRLHGHTYKVTVNLTAESLDSNGMIADFSVISAVIKKYDHNNLNEMMQIPTTAENLAYKIHCDLYHRLVTGHNKARNINTISVTVSETPSSSVTFDGGSIH